MNQTITGVRGVLGGHWTHSSGTTGTTVLLFSEGARGGYHPAGSAIGGRQLNVFDPTHVADVLHGLCLSGGSAYGLSAADGVLAFLEERGIGFNAGAAVVPIVPTAIIYDLGVAAARPDSEAGRRAAEAATDAPLPEGGVGAGAGARVGKWLGAPMAGGVGSWSDVCDGWSVGSLAVVNAVGTVRDPEDGRWIGRPFDAGLPAPVVVGGWRGNTTLVVVATDAPLDRIRATVLARMAAAGVARSLYPAFTPFDGDVVFAVSTTPAERPVALDVLTRLGAVAAACVSRSIVRAVERG